MAKLRYSMKVVSQRTGLSAHVLRVWERRYGAVEPDRSESNRRLYAEEEVVRLEYLAKLTRAGHGIRQIATLPSDELEAMVMALPAAVAVEEVPDRPGAGPPDAEILNEAWAYVRDLDLAGLRRVLEKASVTLGMTGFSENLIVPLVARIGAGWESGELSVTEEHAASAVIREVLFASSRPFAESAGAPGIVVATPTGQHHELGAVLVSAMARRLGWDVTHLGVSLPAGEIARAVVRSGALALGLSIVYPGDDAELPDELRRLRRLLPAEVAILVGGRSAGAYEAVIREIGASVVGDLSGFRATLEKLRAQRVAG
jgi:DNA-binding transcriptional MerR regulator/methanogenic corrinoid protein MtbC1